MAPDATATPQSRGKRLVMITNHKWLCAALPALALAACAETTFQDTLGIGKSAPDETKVRTVQPLSVPPDLQLRPPSGASSRVANADDTGASANTGALAAPPTQAAPARALNRAAQPPAAPNGPGADKPSGDFYDIYRKHGISLYDENGKRKSITKLNTELGKKLKEERRRKNPRYGTIFNIDSIWKE